MLKNADNIVLVALATWKDQIDTQGRLAEALHLSPSGMTRSLNRLAEAQLIGDVGSGGAEGASLATAAVRQGDRLAQQVFGDLDWVMLFHRGMAGVVVKVLDAPSLALPRTQGRGRRFSLSPTERTWMRRK